MGSALDQLTPADQVLATAYADPNSDTFSNKTRSYMKAHPEANYGTAATQASTALKKPQLKTAVQELLDNYGATYEVRMRDLVDGALGRTQDTIVTVRRDKDGKVIEETTVTKPIPHSSRTKYHQMLLELSGDADRAKAESKIRTDAMIAASKRIMRRVRAENGRQETQGPEEVESHQGPHSDGIVSEYIDARASLAAVAAQIKDMRAQGMDDSAVLDALSVYTDADTQTGVGHSGGIEGGRGAWFYYS